MTTLTIPDLPDSVLAALRERAAKAGRSVEDEARAALADTSPAQRRAPDPDAAAAALRDLVRAANGGRLPFDSVDLFIAERRLEAAQEEAQAAEQFADYVRRLSKP